MNVWKSFLKTFSLHTLVSPNFFSQDHEIHRKRSPYIQFLVRPIRESSLAIYRCPIMHIQNPGIIRADPGHQKETLFRAQFGLQFPISGSSFRVPVEPVSTPTENPVLNGYLTKITILIVILPCNLAGFYGPLFLAQPHWDVFWENHPANALGSLLLRSRQRI